MPYLIAPEMTARTVIPCLEYGMPTDEWLSWLQPSGQFGLLSDVHYLLRGRSHIATRAMGVLSRFPHTISDMYPPVAGATC